MATTAVPAPLALLPNALTIGRLLLIPVFVVLMVQADGGPSWPAGIVFAVAGVTDQIDGFLARRWHVESHFGKIADPLADRLMIDTAVILLVAYGRLPWAGLVVIVARDLLLLVGWRLLAPRGIDLEVNLPARRDVAALHRHRHAHRHAQRHELALVALLDRPRRGRRGSRAVRVELGRAAAVKAVVMAGGEGTRLRPLTSNQPKPMVPIVGKPHGAHPRALEAARVRGGDRDGCLPAAGDPLVLRRRRDSAWTSRTRWRRRRSGRPARYGSRPDGSTTRSSSSPATHFATST
jgi:phosphatidylglycerophosphate synthase